MLINFGKKFSKQYDRVDLKIKIALKERLRIFKTDPHNPVLNNHILTGEFLGKRSINITGDWRAIYSETVDEEGNKTVIFELIGTHSQLYK